jgi:hypothetical protein
MQLSPDGLVQTENMKALATATLMTAFWASPTSACQPRAGDVYDEIPFGKMTIAIARVQSVSPLAETANGQCVQIAYDLIEALAGTPSTHFAVSICDDNVEAAAAAESAAEISSTEAQDDVYGLALGAISLVGLLPLQEDSNQYRYAFPDCWGAFSVNLGLLPADEQRTFRDEIVRKIQSGE